MADKFMKIKDVEKEKRLKYIWDYYKVPFLVTVAIIIMSVSIIKTVFFATRPDSYVFMVTANNPNGAYIMEDVGVVLNENIKDFNGDEKTVIEYASIPLGGNENDPDIELQRTLATKFSALLTTGQYIIQIADAESFDYLKANHLVADWSVFEKYGFDTKGREGIIKIPLKDTVFSKISEGAIMDDLFITIRPDSQSSNWSEKRKDYYINQLEFFMSLIK